MRCASSGSRPVAAAARQLSRSQSSSLAAALATKATCAPRPRRPWARSKKQKGRSAQPAGSLSGVDVERAFASDCFSRKGDRGKVFSHTKLSQRAWSLFLYHRQAENYAPRLRSVNAFVQLLLQRALGLCGQTTLLGLLPRQLGEDR